MSFDPLLATFALVVVLCGLIASLVLRRADADRADEWALFNGVALTARTAPVVERYLDNRRSLRRGGAIGGALLAPAFTAAFGIDLRVNGVAWLLLGYLVGAIVAELTLTRVPGPHRRTASLATRRVRTYLPTLVLVMQGLLPVVVIALSVAAVLIAPPLDPTLYPSWGDGPVADQRIGALWAGPVALVITIVVLGGQRYLVRRPRPSGPDDVLAVDDAMRASAVRLVGATACTILTTLATAQVIYLGNAVADRPRVGTLLGVGALTFVSVGLLCWFGRLPRGDRRRTARRWPSSPAGTSPAIAAPEGRR